ncbi:hypothetical protein CIK05_05940 [Bdellovibrio sp. qaytius]|nr:hypothetical protein CIK05_05940 [Bdellovibrio sp. qaytius]
MRKNLHHVLILSAALFLSAQANAFTANHWWVGLGYYSENALNKVATDATGKTGFLGTANYPLIVKYDLAAWQSWFVAPQLNYTLLPRETKGNGAKVTLTHLVFNIGQNTSSDFEWSFGPGILRETIQGKGGTTTLNNGTGTSTFANPGRTVSIHKITLDVGGALTSGRMRYGLDLYFVAPFSSKERTQNLMLSFAYDLSASSSGGGGGMFLWSR